MSEKQLAKKINATLVSNSGRGFKKGDAKTDRLLIDFKETDKKSFSVNVDKFKKHQKDAWREGLEGAIVCCFEADNSKLLATVDYAFIDSLIHEIYELEDELNYYKDIVEAY